MSGRSIDSVGISTSEGVKQFKVVSPEQWLAARKELLALEKEATRQRDALSRKRRDMPWELVEKQYVFDGPNGQRETLAELFGNQSQLIVYHFMFAPDSKEGCASCSMGADAFNGLDVHLRHRDTAFVVISRASVPQLEAYKKRLGWSFKWVSSGGSGNSFNHDYFASYTPEEVANGAFFNYKNGKPWGPDISGYSVFAKDAAGHIYHTYSTYARGAELMNTAYQLADLTPKGRDEADQAFPQAWVRRHDQYEDSSDSCCAPNNSAKVA